MRYVFETILAAACNLTLAHAASAYYASPFERAAVMTLDGRGERATTSYGIGNGNGIGNERRCVARRYACLRGLLLPPPRPQIGDLRTACGRF